MTVLDFRLYFKYLDAKNETEDNVRRIQDITKKKPAPLKENVEAIENDIKIMQEKNAEIHRMFGKMYRAPLQRFAKTIGMTEDALLKDFREYYQKLPDGRKGGVTGETDKQILDEFLKGFFWPKKEDGTFVDGPEDKLKLDIRQQTMKNQIKRALMEFEKFAADNYLDYDNNGFKFLLDALGLPHTELASTFKRQMIQVNEKIISGELIPGLEEKSENKDSRGGNRSGTRKVSGVSYYTFDVENLPLQRETYLACRQLHIRLDLYHRMKKSKLSSVPVIDQITEMEGKKMEGDAYLCYSYKIEVEGTMDSIRNFLNNLTDAYKDNVVYNIREVQLTRPNPEDVSKLTGRFGSDGVRDRDGKLSEAYGRVVLGENPNVHCYILLDYIMFVQDLLKRQVPQQK